MRNYATQMDAAKRGIVTPEIEMVAKKENRPVEFIMERVAKGTIAIPANINHKSLSAEAVGDGTRVKINVNLGISGDCKDYEMEMRKVRMAIASKGKGKSHGARVITYTEAIVCADNEGTVILLTIYDKADRDSISAAEIDELLRSLRWEL